MFLTDRVAASVSASCCGSWSKAEIDRLEHQRIGQNAGALDCVFEFANIAGPVMLLQCRERFGAQLRFAAAQFASDLGGKVMRQQNDVVTAIAERRHLDRKHRQTKKQITTKLPILDGGFQVFVRRRDNTNINRNRRTAADTIDHLFLDRAQQFALNAQAATHRSRREKPCRLMPVQTYPGADRSRR